MRRPRAVLAGVSIALGAFLFQVILQTAMRPAAADGLHLQPWSSETMMQTVSVADLRRAPLETLFSIHLQPPALDLIRAILAHAWPSADDATSLRQVDFLLYVLWALVYGGLGFAIFWWLLRWTRMAFAAVAAVVFLLHPACMFYATFLETTLLSSFLVLVMYYLLWRTRQSRELPLAATAAVMLALYFTRSLFQWPFILLFSGSLCLCGAPWRKVLLLLGVVGSVVGLHMAKQYYQFGIVSTTSFTGFSLTRSVGMTISPTYPECLDSALRKSHRDLPSALTRTNKIDGSRNFNHVSYLSINRQLITLYRQYVHETPWSTLASYYFHNNLKLYLRPSSRYTPHVIVDRLPWRSWYDGFFSSPILVVILLASGLAWSVRVVRERSYLSSLGLLLPGLYVFAGSVLLDSGENMRFKFFLEPVMFIAMASRLLAVGQQVYRRMLEGR